MVIKNNGAWLAALTELVNRVGVIAGHPKHHIAVNQDALISAYNKFKELGGVDAMTTAVLGLVKEAAKAEEAQQIISHEDVLEIITVCEQAVSEIDRSAMPHNTAVMLLNVFKLVIDVVGQAFPGGYYGKCEGCGEPRGNAEMMLNLDAGPDMCNECIERGNEEGQVR